MQQGTGLGLSLCKRLSELLGAEISHDRTYNCGVEGFKGTRFIIDLKKPPAVLAEALDSTVRPSLFPINDRDNQVDLPDSLSVLFVDDDIILRKLFARAIKRCAPNWSVQEVASGESAVRMIDQEQSFDVIFMDQYMAGVGRKQLLGTETVRLLRSKGVSSFVCGLSANQLEASFIEAGANAFIMKPLPADPKQLGTILSEILSSRKDLEAGREESCPQHVTI